MGRLKQEMTLPDGRPMIAIVHHALAAVCPRVVLLGQSPHLPGLERVADLREGCGPLGGIEALLASEMGEQYLVVPCDMPRVTADVLDALLIKSDQPATVFEGYPLPARISADALPTVKRLLDSGERAVWRLLDDVVAERVPMRDAWIARLENVNTPEDVERIARRSTQRSPSDRG